MGDMGASRQLSWICVCTHTLIYLQFGEICAGSHHVPATAEAASLLCRNQDISDLGVPWDITPGTYRLYNRYLLFIHRLCYCCCTSGQIDILRYRRALVALSGHICTAHTFPASSFLDFQDRISLYSPAFYCLWILWCDVAATVLTCDIRVYACWYTKRVLFYWNAII